MANAKKKTRTVDPEKTYEKCVEELADVVVEGLREGYHSDLEPFEAYAQKVRSQIHRDVDQFRERFTKGYHVLLRELSQNPPS